MNDAKSIKNYQEKDFKSFQIIKVEFIVKRVFKKLPSDYEKYIPLFFYYF